LARPCRQRLSVFALRQQSATQAEQHTPKFRNAINELRDHSAFDQPEILAHLQVMLDLAR